MAEKLNEQFLDSLARQNDMVVQGNDLSKSLGNLKAFDQHVLDMCFSKVKEDDNESQVYWINATEIINQLGLVDSGKNYERVANSFRSLMKNTVLYLPRKRENGTASVRMINLFEFAEIDENGGINFKFSHMATPLVFQLKENFHYYSFHVYDIANISGKYGSILLKLWANYHRKKNGNFTKIQATVEEWEEWMLGNDKRIPAGRFWNNCLKRAINELEKKMNVTIACTSIKKGRKVISYVVEFNDHNSKIK